MKALNNKLKQIDNFQRIPREMRESSKVSVVMSLLCLITIVYLSCSTTFNFFFKREHSSEFHVHQAQKNELMQVNLAIKLFRLPCELVSVDVMDKMGKHQLHVGAGLYIQSLDSHGKLTGEKTKVKDIDPKTWDGGKKMNFKKILEKFRIKEGCFLSGNLSIRKVPGNFHISAHAFPIVLRKLMFNGGDIYQNLDLSHEIVEMYFGTAEEKQKAYEQFYYPNIEYLKKYHDSSAGFVTKDSALFHEYYLRIVPSFFIQDQNKIHYNQYTANHQSYHTEDLPAIFFKYETSPIEMSNIITKDRLFQYIVDLCAIIGGVYYLAKLTDALLHSGIKTIRAKTRMGKQY